MNENFPPKPHLDQIHTTPDGKRYKYQYSLEGGGLAWVEIPTSTPQDIADQIEPTIQVVQLNGLMETEYATGPIGPATTNAINNINGKDPSISVEITTIPQTIYDEALQQGFATTHPDDNTLAEWITAWATNDGE